MFALIAFLLPFVLWILPIEAFYGLVIGLYAVCFSKTDVRRRKKIAFVHMGLLGILMVYELFCGFLPRECYEWIFRIKYPYWSPYLFMMGGFAFTMTYPGHQLPLCPKPKLRMGIIMALPFTWIVLELINKVIALFSGYLSTRLIYIVYGILLGIALWMTERLNDTNRLRVFAFNQVMMSLLIIVNLNRDTYLFATLFVWSVSFSLFGMFKTKFISRSQN